jgi:hypothetical protein
VRTRAWTHPILRDHVSRVDLDHAVASIGVRLQELVSLREEIEGIRDAGTAKSVETYLSETGRRVLVDGAPGGVDARIL